jgi:polyisoprenoid-binding protein YceI
MKQLLFSAVLVALTAPLALAQTTTWAPDPAHSEVDFAIRHMSLTTVHGRFGKVTGTILLDQANLAKSSVQVTIDVTGVDTGNTARDNDLKGSNYFDVAHYPTATFTSTSVQKTANDLIVSGNLSLRGVTKPVTLDVEGPDGPVTGMDHKPHTGYSATATISRTAFGIGTKVPVAVLGDEVKLTIELDAVRQ